MMKANSCVLILLAAFAIKPPANAEEAEPTYLFTSFRGNGEDGLYLAYSRDGLYWSPLNNNRPLLAPQVGEAQLMRDPSIARGPDGTFHMVWTVGWWEQGIGYAHSRNLIDWSEQRYLPVMEHEPKARNCWAPELFYDEETEEFLIVWSTTIPGRYPKTPGSPEADCPEDDIRSHRMYFVTTRDFETLSDTKLFYDRGFNVIDGFIVRRGPQDYVLFLKDESFDPAEKNVRVAYAGKATGPYSHPSEPIHGDYWAEGPAAIPIGDFWYVYFDRYRKPYRGLYGAVRTRDFQTWEDISGRVNVPRGMRHGTVLIIDENILAELKMLGAEK